MVLLTYRHIAHTVLSTDEHPRLAGSFVLPYFPDLESGTTQKTKRTRETQSKILEDPPQEPPSQLETTPTAPSFHITRTYTIPSRASIERLRWTHFTVAGEVNHFYTTN